jgi:hypothetical protein
VVSGGWGRGSYYLFLCLSLEVTGQS